MKKIASLILILSAVSCVSTTTIKSIDKEGKIDKDVEIYVGGKHIGSGKAKYSDNKTVYSSVPFLELKKEGCKSLREKLDVKTSWVNSIVGGITTGVGFGIMSLPIQNALVFGLPISIAGLISLFWTRKYVPIQEHEFQCIKIADK